MAFPSVHAALRWYFELRSVIGTARALNPRPKWVDKPSAVDFFPATLGRLIDIGAALDELPADEKEAVERHYSDWEPRDRFEGHRYRVRWHAAMSRLGRSLRLKGIVATDLPERGRIGDGEAVHKLLEARQLETGGWWGVSVCRRWAGVVVPTRDHVTCLWCGKK